MNSRGRHIIEFLLIAVALAAAVFNLPYISDMQDPDEFYQGLACTYYHRSSPLAPLSYYMGYVFTSVFGNTLMSLRVLMLLCSVASISLGLWYFYRRTRDGLMCSLLFFALLTASQIWGMNIYNWDTGCYPFAMCGLIASLAYLGRPTLRRAMVLAAAWALMLASRVPMGLTLPFLIAEVIWCHRGDRSEWMRQLACCAFVALAVLAALTLLIYGSFGALVDAWAPENIITGHLEGHRHHISRIFITGELVTMNGLIAATVAVGAFMAARLKRGRIWVALAASVLLILEISGLHMFVYTDIRFNAFALITYALCFYPVYRKWSRGEKAGFMPRVWLTLMFVLCTWPGSDGYWERPMTLSTMPVALTLCYTPLRRYMHPLAAYMALALAVALAVKIPYYREHHEFAFTEKYPRAAGVYIKPETQRTVPLIDSILTATPDSIGPVWVIGNGAYGVEYLTDRHDVTPQFHHFHWLNAWHDADYAKRMLVRYNMVIETSAYHHSRVDSAAFDSLIREQGFELAARIAPTNVYRRMKNSDSREK